MFMSLVTWTVVSMLAATPLGVLSLLAGLQGGCFFEVGITLIQMPVQVFLSGLKILTTTILTTIQLWGCSLIRLTNGLCCLLVTTLQIGAILGVLLTLSVGVAPVAWLADVPIRLIFSIKSLFVFLLPQSLTLLNVIFSLWFPRNSEKDTDTVEEQEESDWSSMPMPELEDVHKAANVSSQDRNSAKCTARECSFLSISTLLQFLLMFLLPAYVFGAEDDLRRSLKFDPTKRIPMLVEGNYSDWSWRISTVFVSLGVGAGLLSMYQPWQDVGAVNPDLIQEDGTYANTEEIRSLKQEIAVLKMQKSLASGDDAHKIHAELAEKKVELSTKVEIAKSLYVESCKVTPFSNLTAKAN